jgi:hypothetical protein
LADCIVDLTVHQLTNKKVVITPQFQVSTENAQLLSANMRMQKKFVRLGMNK